jgi:hypothetical protein
MGSKYTDYLELPFPYQKTLNIIKHAVEHKHKLIHFDEVNGTIIAKVGISFYSFGEYLRVKVSPNQNNTSSLIYFESECKVSTTLVDYGKNKRNITNLISSLKKLAIIS